MRTVKLKNIPEDSLFVIDCLPGVQLKLAPNEKWIEYSYGTLRPYYNIVTKGRYIWLDDDQFGTFFPNNDLDHSIFGWHNN